MEVTPEQIRRSGVGTAWQALRLLGGSFRVEEDSQGMATRVRIRGRTSIHSNLEPQFVLDGIRIHDYRLLQAIPASSVSGIRLVTGPDATVFWGPDAHDGVVIVTTSRGGGAESWQVEGEADAT
jgi:outer membrane receptor protein involved in Fe transport